MDFGRYQLTCAVVGESHCKCSQLIRLFTSQSGEHDKPPPAYRDNLYGAILYNDCVYDITIKHTKTCAYEEHFEDLYKSLDFAIFMFSLTSPYSLESVREQFANDIFFISPSAQIILVACDGYLRTSNPELVKISRQNVEDIATDIGAFNVIELQKLDAATVARVFECAVAASCPWIYPRYLRGKPDYDCVGVILPLGKEGICRRDVIKKVGHWRVLMTTDTEGLRIARKDMFKTPVALVLEFDTEYPEELCKTIESNIELIQKHWNVPIVFAGHGKKFDINKKWIEIAGKGITGCLAHERYRKLGAFAKHVVKVTERARGPVKRRRRTF